MNGSPIKDLGDDVWPLGLFFFRILGRKLMGNQVDQFVPFPNTQRLSILS